MLAAGADVVDEDRVLGDLVTVLGMVPIPPGVGDQQPVPVDQGIIDGDDALVAVAGGGVLLEQVESSLIQILGVPGGLGQEAIEAGLVGGLGELVVDAQDGLALGDHQPGEVLGEVPPLGLVGEEVAELGEGVPDDLGEFDDAWHDQMPRGTNCAGAYETEKGLLLPILPASPVGLQNLSWKSRPNDQSI